MERQLPRGAAVGEATTDYAVRPLKDRQAIAARLEGQRGYAAYALGQLESAYFPLAKWWLVESPAGEEALVLHSRGGLGEALFTLGDGEAVDACLRLHPGPLRTYVTCRPDHLPAVKRHFFLQHEQTMMRMGVGAGDFEPAADGWEPRRLHGLDVRDLNLLYGSDGGSTFYTSWHLQEGMYYGVWDGRRLIAAAGTHVIAPTSGVAVVGNVFTHPAWRGRALARATTGAVTQALLKSLSRGGADGRSSQPAGCGRLQAPRLW